MREGSVRSPADFWLNVGLVLLGVGVVLVAVQAGAVAVLAWLCGVSFPLLTVWSLLSLWSLPDPSFLTGLPGGAVAHWVVVAVIAAVVVVFPVLLWQRHVVRSGGFAKRGGMASRRQLRRFLGAGQLVSRAKVLRPGLSGLVKPEMVGYQLGVADGVGVWASVEDSMILVGATRSGKGTYFVVGMLTKAMGAVVTTSTRADNLALTIELRKRLSDQVWVFDPAGFASGAGSTLRWSPVAGAEDIDVAMRRLRSLIPGGGFRGVKDAGYWEATSKKILLALFHAAALDGRTVDDFWAWMSDANLARSQALEILNTHPEADRAVARSLHAVLTGSTEQRGNDWAAAYADVAYLASPKVRAALVPVGDENFDPFDFIMERGTLYMIGDAVAAAQFEQVIVALLEEISTTAQGIAGASVGSRVDPPVQFILDEAANFKVPTLPKLISYSGGSGMTVVVVLQSVAQAQREWGADGARALWAASSVKMILPGGGDARELKDLETLIGEVEIERRSYSTSRGGGISHQYARQEKRILRANEIRTLPFGTGLLFFRNVKPVIVKLCPWTELPISAELLRDREVVTKRMAAASVYADRLTAYRGRNKS